MRRERDLQKVSARQLGLITARQCRELHVSREWQSERVAQGSWQRIYRGVFKVGAGPLSADEREMAVLLYAGSGAVLSHHTAARRLGMEVPRTSQIHVTVSHGRVVAAPKGVRVWRSRDLDVRDIRRVGPFQVTAMARTLLDLSGELSEVWLRSTVDSCLRGRRSALSWLRRVLNEEGRGRDGAARLRKLLDSYDERTELPDSVLESFALELAKAVGTAPALHHNVQTTRGWLGEVDLAWPNVRLAVELDSWAHHGSRTAFERDRERDRALQAHGWEVLRYTWQSVTNGRRRMCQELVEAYTRRAARPRTAS